MMFYICYPIWVIYKTPKPDELSVLDVELTLKELVEDERKSRYTGHIGHLHIEWRQTNK
jgi:hypothetical protein